MVAVDRRERVIPVISIRPIQKKDAYDMFRIASANYPRKYQDPYIYMQGLWAKLREKDPQDRSFVALSDDQIAGYMFLQITHPNQIFASDFNTAHDRRSFTLITQMLMHVFKVSQKKEIHLQARTETTYKALQRRGMQRWLRENGYDIQHYCRDECIKNPKAWDQMGHMMGLVPKQVTT